MKAGFYECDITPALGMERPGDYYKTYIEKIHDPLKVRAAVVDDGKTKVALVGVDTCILGSARMVGEARRQIEERCGIKGDHILIAASHTHSGGPLHGFLPQDFEGAQDLVRTLALEHSVTADPIYCDLVVRCICSAVCEADCRRQDADMAVGVGMEDRVSFNRRFRMKNGRTYTHPGKGNPDILEPAGPIDPEVGVVAAWDRAGNLLGCIVNFACHGTTFDGGASADWIHYLEKTIQGATGSAAPVVFLNGACGDVTQVDNLSTSEAEFGEKYARLVGTRVGAEAVKIIVSATPGELAPVAAAQRILQLKRRTPQRERVEQSRRVVEERFARGDTQGAEWVFAKELLIADFLVASEPVVPVEVQAIQIGPAVFLANPSEFFCELGLDIKRASRFPFTFVVELANGAVGYVPTEEAFSPSGGGYETVLTSYSNLETTAGAKIIKASLELAEQLKPGLVPEAPKAAQPSPVWADGAAASSPAWDYGILGPDV